MKTNYLVIPLIVVLVAWLGGLITSAGMDWYETINLPDFTPPGYVIGTVWTIIFILTAMTALIVWNSFPRGKRFNWTISVFLVNAFLNVFWSYLFFGEHLLGLAIWDAGILAFSVALLIVALRPFSRLAAILLYPYLLWVVFATYLTYTVWALN